MPVKFSTNFFLVILGFSLDYNVFQEESSPNLNNWPKFKLEFRILIDFEIFVEICFLNINQWPKVIQLWTYPIWGDWVYTGVGYFGVENAQGGILFAVSCCCWIGVMRTATSWLEMIGKGVDDVGGCSWLSRSFGSKAKIWSGESHSILKAEKTTFYFIMIIKRIWSLVGIALW